MQSIREMKEELKHCKIFIERVNTALQSGKISAEAAARQIRITENRISELKTEMDQAWLEGRADQPSWIERREW